MFANEKDHTMKHETHMKVCPICGATHNKRKAVCCCIAHSQELSRRNHFRKPVVEKTCPRCGKPHTKSGRFCSISCAHSHMVSLEHRQKTSASIKKYRKSVNPDYVPEADKMRTCVYCGRGFYSSVRRKCCSKSCFEKLRNERMAKLSPRAIQVCRENGHLGGYREGTGKAKTGYYKGFYCGSTYELVWLIYQLDHGRDVQRFPGMLQWNGVKYIPDFLQDGKIVELKGYWQKRVDEKCEVARRCGYDIVVLYGDDLREEFRWVKEHYQYKRVEELYDDYKPKFELTCCHCHQIFYRDTAPKTETVFCSPRCAGLERACRRHK